MQLLVAVDGRYEQSLSIPADPGLAGVQFRRQVLQLELGAQGQVTSLFGSNGLRLTIRGW